MEFSFSSLSPLSIDADLLVVCTHGDPFKDGLFTLVDRALDGHLTTRARGEEFAGKPGQVLLTDRAVGSARSVAVIGASDLKGFDPPRSRDMAAIAVRVARRCGARSVVVALPPVAARSSNHALQIAVEGALLGSYRFVKYRAEEAKRADPVEQVTFTTERGRPGRKASKGEAAALREARASIDRARIVAAAICHARDLINEPAAAMTPVQLAEEARQLAKTHPLTVKVLTPAECAKLGMGMFLAVGQGSDQEPRLIHLTYQPKRKKPSRRVVLIGKGVTFDSGGYSLKPTQSMEDMKVDMSGAAAVIAAMAAIAQLGSSCEVHAIAACCENLVSGNAYKLGDVLRAMDGTTVEILNTDAEGRLTLGDAITYARQKVQPDEIIDFATLTGACMVALGPHTAGVFSDHDALVNRWLAAGRAAGEDMWRLPLLVRLKEQLKSPIADLKNVGDRFGGAITAGLFLKHFARDTPWIHVDIAGPASSSRESGACPRGGTGFAVASIIEYLTRA